MSAPATSERLRPELPPELDEVIARGMAKDPAERFDSASELAHACARALGIAELVAPAKRPAVGDEQRGMPPGDRTPTALSD